MSTLGNLIITSGDAAKELLKSNLLELIHEATEESESIVKETGVNIEKWLELKIKGEIEYDELVELLKARRSTVSQFLNSQEMSTRARLEKITIGLIDLVLNKALDSIL